MTARFQREGLNFPAPEPGGADPADANYSTDWQETIGKLGFTAVVVQMDPNHGRSDLSSLFESLGDEMNCAGLGHLDSGQRQPHIRVFFYAETNRLVAALEFLKIGLARQNLLPHAAIGHYDATGKTWREFYPGLKHE